jgi:hypothetical protein
MASPIVTNTSAQLNGASLVYGFATTLTDAQIKALPTTPVTLVSAPASGSRIKVMGGSASLNTTAGAYTNINTVYCAVQIDNPSGDWMAGPLAVNDSSMTTPLTNVTSWFGGAAHLVIDIPCPAMKPIDAGAVSGHSEWIQPFGASVSSHVDATAVRISVDNGGSGVWTGGNSANSLIVTLYYAVELV